MIMNIRVNNREVPFVNALLHLCINIRTEFVVHEYNDYSFKINTLQQRGSKIDPSYSCYNTKPILRLLQLVQAVRGFGMDNVQTPSIFMGDEGFERWDRLQNFQGEYRVKMALAYLGGMNFTFESDLLSVTEQKLEKLCEAYVLHEEDRRTSMKDWLEELTRKASV